MTGASIEKQKRSDSFMNTRRLLSTFAAVLLLCTLALTGCSTKKASDASSDADLLARFLERG